MADSSRNIFHLTARWFRRANPAFGTRTGLIFCVLYAVSAVLVGIYSDSILFITAGLLASTDLGRGILVHAAIIRMIKMPGYSPEKESDRYTSLANLSAGIIALVITFFILYYVAWDSNPTGEPGHISMIILVVIAAIIMTQLGRIQESTGRRYSFDLLIYDAQMWRQSMYLQAGLLIMAMLMIYSKNQTNSGIGSFADNAAALVLCIYYLALPALKIKKSLDSLLERNIPEQLQYDVLTIVADNIDRICEYKSMSVKKAGKKLFVVVEMVLPDNITLSQKFGLEAEFRKNLSKKYPESSLMLYAAPCDSKCEHKGNNSCPIKRAYFENDAEQ